MSEELVPTLSTSAMIGDPNATRSSSRCLDNMLIDAPKNASAA